MKRASELFAPRDRWGGMDCLQIATVKFELKESFLGRASYKLDHESDIVANIDSSLTPNFAHFINLVV